MTRTEVETYINGLKGYEGYVQFSDEKIGVKDIFIGYQDIAIEPREGFVYEAHFFNGTDSIAIRQINDVFYVHEEKSLDLSEENVNVYKSKFGEVRMVQIWEEEEDPLCEQMVVKKLKKVLFAGFVNGGSK